MSLPAAMLGQWELLLILAIVLIIFGVGKLPKVLKQLGQGVKEFRDAADGSKKEVGSEDGDAARSSEQQVEKNL